MLRTASKYTAAVGAHSICARAVLRQVPRADMESAPTILFWPLGQNSTFFIIFVIDNDTIIIK